MAIGPSTITAPYILNVEPNVRYTSIATVVDPTPLFTSEGAPTRMVGIPDGLGAYDNGDGTLTLLMNHEIGAIQGIVRAHGAAGAFVSKWIIDKDDLSVVSVDDAITQVKLWNDATEEFYDATYAIGRLCSADLAPQSAYKWTDPVTGITYGTDDKIFLTGEEIGAEGKEFGLVVTGEEAGIAYELAYLGLFSWENAISSPYAQKKTINIGMDDSSPGQVYVYIGEKKTEGTAVDKAGLNDGKLYGIKALNLFNAANPALSNETDATPASGRFELVDEGDVSKLTGAELNAKSESLGVTDFLRPEDGQFDTLNPNVFWFVTTASFNGQSRLYKLTFDDIENPEAGGTIEVALSSSDLPVNGTVGPRMMDNMTVAADGKIYIQEDVGNSPFLGRVLQYDPATDTLVVVGEHDPFNFAANAPIPITQDEESSGIIDVTSILGDEDTQAFLLDVQAHRNLTAITTPFFQEQVQDGQLLAMFIDDVKLNGTNRGNDDLFGSQEDETFKGLGGDDTIRAGSGNDKIVAGAGDDWIDAGRGDDNVNGGKGSDTIIGGLGRDSLTGGSEADTFVFVSIADSVIGNADRINDFVKGEDKIDLSGIDAINFTTNDDAFVLVSAFTGAGGELVQSRKGQIVTVLGDVDGDGQADFAIEVKSQLALQNADFIF